MSRPPNDRRASRGASGDEGPPYVGALLRQCLEHVRARMEADIKAAGFTALKWDPFPGPWRSFIHQQDEDHVVRYVKAMRETLGPDFTLLVEVHRRLAPMHAIRIGRRIATIVAGTSGAS